MDCPANLWMMVSCSQGYVHQGQQAHQHLNLEARLKQLNSCVLHNLCLGQCGPKQEVHLVRDLSQEADLAAHVLGLVL